VSNHIKKIIRYNPAISTLNVGDKIIFESIKEQLAPIFENSFNIDVSSHLPISYIFTRLLEKADYKFVCGTNLLMGNLCWIFRQWDINIFNAKKLGPAILIGAGWWQYNNNPNFYTKQVYNRILSKDILHSVRDNYTKKMLNDIGFDNVITTACPTMWKLTPEFCKTISQRKGQYAITTLTDYYRDIDKDNKLLNSLYENYDKVFLWLQGVDDYEYLKSLKVSDKLQIVYPELSNYDNILLNEDVDYIGTRLHGGVRALQKGKRTVILAVDNRALEKQKDFKLPVLSRNDIDKLDEKINSNFETKINIPLNEINIWKKQFGL
jgi:hypothetical protein